MKVLQNPVLEAFPATNSDDPLALGDDVSFLLHMYI